MRCESQCLDSREPVVELAVPSSKPSISGRLPCRSAATSLLAALLEAFEQFLLRLLVQGEHLVPGRRRAELAPLADRVARLLQLALQAPRRLRLQDLLAGQ